MIQFPQTFAIVNRTKSNGLLRRTRLKEKIARCILTERLIEHVPSPTKMIHAPAVTADLYLFHSLTNHIQQNNLNLCHSKNSILRTSTRSAAKPSPNPFIRSALKN